MKDEHIIPKIFTPRSAEVNLEMYAPRPDLEKKLIRSIHNNIHTIISGESGNGKSWLYKKVLQEIELPFTIVNSSKIALRNSLVDYLLECTTKPGSMQKTKQTEEISGEIGISFAKGGGVVNKEYSIAQESKLISAFKNINQAGKKKHIIVIDNLEVIFENHALMNELAHILLLLDDDEISKYNINFLLVGTPVEIREYFSELTNLSSVSNRLEELPIVSGLSSDNINHIFQTGFRLIGISTKDINTEEIIRHIEEITLGVAQSVQEYCRNLAYNVVDNKWQLSLDLLPRTDRSWVISGLDKAYLVVTSHANLNTEKISRKNQTIYAISKIKTRNFEEKDIVHIIENLFPQTVPKSGIQLASILLALTEGDNPLLRKDKKKKQYWVNDPRYIMTIRLTFFQNNNRKLMIKKYRFV